MFGQVGDHLGPHPGRRGREGGLELGHAVDPEQRRVLLGQPEEERPGADLDAEVAVGAARLDRGDPRVVSPPLRNGRDHRIEFTIEAHGARP